MGEFTAWNLSSILWAWAKMNYEDMPPDLLEQLMGATRQRMFDFKPQELKNVIWAYATMMNHPGEQFLKVSEPPLKTHRWKWGKLPALATVGATSRVLPLLSAVYHRVCSHTHCRRADFFFEVRRVSLSRMCTSRLAISAACAPPDSRSQPHVHLPPRDRSGGARQHAPARQLAHV
eukprot:1998569-Pyramimonas_sp.AAC.1